MQDLYETLQEYFQAWNEAMATKDSQSIRSYMSEDFVGYWSHAGDDEPEPYRYHYNLDAVLNQMNNAKKSFEPYTITERGNGQEYVTIGRETNTINGHPHTALCMFVWRVEDQGLKLLREYIELED
ncbi:nuclear transport factor 2 family protein [Pontibacillus halophilus]|uniref:nuclear transport factor 2 family protein n=1 Tax=Pontibacillus halophilus TaxID=516704 RepID=UPI00047C3D30|nr:nuclear transport factor 2 family protein [Pontibacillus halophilus]